MLAGEHQRVLDAILRTSPSACLQMQLHEAGTWERTPAVVSQPMVCNAKFFFHLLQLQTAASNSKEPTQALRTFRGRKSTQQRNWPAQGRQGTAQLCLLRSRSCWEHEVRQAPALVCAVHWLLDTSMQGTTPSATAPGSGLSQSPSSSVKTPLLLTWESSASGPVCTGELLTWAPVF